MVDVVARGAVIGTGIGIPAAFGADFAAGTAGSALEQLITGGRVDACGSLRNLRRRAGRLSGKRRLRSAGRHDHMARMRAGRAPKRLCGAPDPFDPWNGLGEGSTRGYEYGRNHGTTGGTQESGGFSLGGFIRDTLTGAVLGGLGSAGFYGAGRAVEVLRGSVGRSKGGLETKEIYRAVSPEEYDDIFTTKGFRARPDGRSFQAKEFGNNFEETLEFANKSINIYKAAIIKVTIPENVYNQLEHMNLDHAIFKSGTPVVEPEMLERFNESIICIKHIF